MIHIVLTRIVRTHQLPCGAHRSWSLLSIAYGATIVVVIIYHKTPNPVLPATIQSLTLAHTGQQHLPHSAGPADLKICICFTCDSRCYKLSLMHWSDIPYKYWVYAGCSLSCCKISSNSARYSIRWWALGKGPCPIAHHDDSLRSTSNGYILSIRRGPGKISEVDFSLDSRFPIRFFSVFRIWTKHSLARRVCAWCIVWAPNIQRMR